MNEKVEGMELKPGTFSMDGMNGEVIIPGLSDGSTWNGWENVWLSRENVELWLKSMPIDYSFLADGTLIILGDESDASDYDSFPPIEKDGKVLYCFGWGYCFSRGDGEIRPGDIVKFKDEMPDEIGSRYIVQWVDSPRLLIEYICDMNIKPTQINNIDEIQVIIRPYERKG